MTGYRFITIIKDGNDYADSGNAPTPIHEWNFSDNPFPTQTNEGSWNRRSFVGYSGVVTPTIAPTLYIGWNSNEVVMKGGGACGICNYDRPAHNGPCCNNYNSLTPLPACWQGTPTPTMPTQGIYTTPTPTGSCTFNNHECNPICSIDNFEGGEMWRQISTVGYYDVIVEMTVTASGMSYIPHGMRPSKLGYHSSENVKTVYPNDIFRPYQVCIEPENYLRCVDALMMEEVFMVMFTMEYDSPYNTTGAPVFFDEDEEPAGISKWTVAKMIPRSVLMSDFGGSGKTLRLDFSAWDITDNNEDFGLWIRSQLDSSENQIKIDNIRVFGKRLSQ